MNPLYALAALCLFVQACKSTVKSQNTEDTPASFEEHFADEHTMLLTGEGIAPASLADQGEKALGYARLDARLDAEKKFRDVCYGVAIRPCEPRRRVSVRLAEALKKDLRSTREKCSPATTTEPAACRIDFEFRFEGIRRLCENVRSEDAMKIVTAGCGAF